MPTDKCSAERHSLPGPAAVKVMKIATGEIEETTDDDGKDKAAVELGRKGGRARAKNLTTEERREIARKAAKVRWQGS